MLKWIQAAIFSICLFYEFPGSRVATVFGPSIMALIDFDPLEEFDLETYFKRREWWQSMRGWFAERRYFLYHPQFHEGELISLCYPDISFPATGWSAKSPFLYAYRESHSLEYGECGENYLSTDVPFRSSSVWFAQDRETRLDQTRKTPKSIKYCVGLARMLFRPPRFITSYLSWSF
ncbi:uncharacterized protein EV420DRAFT_1125580 [Desarmillaria tabescens]|uniref:Uncharacterized protein n=1 Tax=Armillaria tabescens TaxID=1929756 RepID=A0AA39JEB0_ARMTA|nr:uncharacterized protein EV420DRAFT_1125580 [Desarmillaria tabescens]KAK0441190.1 hypothetical protein EV420DRAFT_1125580 [Desarmillaria tabescens]